MQKNPLIILGTVLGLSIFFSGAWATDLSDHSHCSQLLSIQSVTAAETRPLHSLAQASFLLAQKPLIDLKTDLEFTDLSQASPAFVFELSQVALSQVADYLFPIFQFETSHTPQLKQRLGSLSQLLNSILQDQVDGMKGFGAANALLVVRQSTDALISNLNALAKAEVEFFQKQLGFEQTPQRLYNLASYIDHGLDQMFFLEDVPSHLAYHPLYLSLFFELREVVESLGPEALSRLSPEWQRALSYAFENSTDLLRNYERQTQNLEMLEVINGPISSGFALQIKGKMEASLRQASNELRQLATNFSAAPESVFSSGH